MSPEAVVTQLLTVVWSSVWLSENEDHVLFSSLPIGVNIVRYNDLCLFIEKLSLEGRQWVKAAESPWGKHGEGQRNSFI